MRGRPRGLPQPVEDSRDVACRTRFAGTSSSIHRHLSIEACPSELLCWWDRSSTSAHIVSAHAVKLEMPKMLRRQERRWASTRLLAASDGDHDSLPYSRIGRTQALRMRIVVRVKIFLLRHIRERRPKALRASYIRRAVSGSDKQSVVIFEPS